MAYTATLDTTNNLVSLDQVDDRLGIASADTDNDNKLTDIINGVSWWFNSQCDRQFKSRSQTEYHDSRGQDVLYFNHPPISAVSIYEDFSIPRAWAASTEIDDDYYEVYTADNIGKVAFTGYTLGNDRRSLKLTYTGGFSTIPYDLVEAALYMIGFLFRSNQYNSYGVTGQERPESGVTFDSTEHPIVATAVAKYRRWGAIV